MLKLLVIKIARKKFNHQNIPFINQFFGRLSINVNNEKVSFDLDF